MPLYTSPRAKIKKTDYRKNWPTYGELKLSDATLRTVKRHSVFKKPFGSFLTKLNILGHSTSRNLSKENEIICPHNNLTQMFIATSFIIAKTGNNQMFIN